MRVQRECEEGSSLRRKIILFLVTLMCMLTACTASAAVTVTDVNWGVDQYNVLRFVVDLTESARYNVNVQPKELQIKIYGGLGNQVFRKSTIKSDLAKVMYVERAKDAVVIRVPVTRTIRRADAKSFILRKDNATGRPPRIVVDLVTNKTDNPSLKYGATSVRRPQVKPSGVGVPPIGPRINFRTGGGIAGKRITIDPGHGGTDPGAIGLKGHKEKDSAFLIAKYVQANLVAAGAQVTLTRTSDKDVYGPYASGKNELQARVDVSTRTRADVFVSIHHNANNNRSVGGVATYYFPKTGNDYRLASKVQNRLTEASKLDDFGTRQANFYVLKRSYMPAILCEIGFLSNPKEEELIASPDFQKAVAKAISDGLIAYFAG